MPPIFCSRTRRQDVPAAQHVRPESSNGQRRVWQFTVGDCGSSYKQRLETGFGAPQGTTHWRVLRSSPSVYSGQFWGVRLVDNASASHGDVERSSGWVGHVNWTPRGDC